MNMSELQIKFYINNKPWYFLTFHVYICDIKNLFIILCK